MSVATGAAVEHAEVRCAASRMSRVSHGLTNINGTATVSPAFTLRTDAMEIEGSPNSICSMSEDTPGTESP